MTAFTYLTTLLVGQLRSRFAAAAALRTSTPPPAAFNLAVARNAWWEAHRDEPEIYTGVGGPGWRQLKFPPHLDPNHKWDIDEESARDNGPVIAGQR